MEILHAVHRNLRLVRETLHTLLEDHEVEGLQVERIDIVRELIGLHIATVDTQGARSLPVDRDGIEARRGADILRRTGNVESDIGAVLGRLAGLVARIGGDNIGIESIQGAIVGEGQLLTRRDVGERVDEVLSLRTAANLDLGDRRQRLSVDGLGRGTEGESSLAHSVVARNDGQVGHGIRRAEQRALGDEDTVHVGAVAVHRALVVETEVIDTVSLDRHGRLEVDPLVLRKVRSRDDLSIGRGIEALAEGSTNLLEIAGHTAAGTEGEVVLAARGEVDLRRDEPVVAGLHRTERTVGYAIGGVILPRATIVVGIDDGEEVEVLLRIEVLLIGHLAGVADENLVGGGLCAVETLIDRGHDIEEGSELALLEGFLKLHLGVVLSHRHATWVADDVVSDLRTIDIAAVCTLRRRTPSQRGLHRLRVDLQFQRGDSLGVVRSHPCGGLGQRATSCGIAGGSKDDVVTLGGRDVDAHLLARLARLGHGLSILDTHGSGQRARQRFATKRRGRSGERSHTTGAALGEGDREVVDLGRRIHVGQGLRHGETDNLLAVGEVGHLRSLCRQGVHLVETRGRVLKRSSPIELVRIAVEGGTLQVERIETRRTDLYDYASLYNDRGTYAPAMMFGRNAWFDAMSTAGNKCCTYMPGSAMEIESLIQQIQSDPANIIITNLSARYGDNDTTIVVRVEGMRNSSAKDGSRITVMLTEDNIAAHGQMGAEGSFTHQHVTRAINSIWGEPIEWDGNKFSYEVSLGLNTVYFTKNDKVQAGNFEEAWRMWNRDNLNIVAFVNYYSTNVEGCAVENVEGAKFNDAINGIEDLPQTKESQTVRSEVYTIDGKRIEADQMGRGLYIIRDIQADGSVHTRKVMRK